MRSYTLFGQCTLNNINTTMRIRLWKVQEIRGLTRDKWSLAPHFKGGLSQKAQLAVLFKRLM